MAGGAPIKPLILTMLAAHSAARTDLSLREFGEAEIHWAIQSGFGPLCFQVSRNNPENSLVRSWHAIEAADLTARLITAEHLEAMRDILDASSGYVESITLLKGISIAEERYLKPHLRPMRDIDILVSETALARMTTILTHLGYEQVCGKMPEFYADHHHLAPFFNKQRGVWLEVHRRLLSAKNRASGNAIFDPGSVAAQIRSAKFLGRDVGRLSPELELIYSATHWAQDFKITGGMVALMDLLFLLRDEGLRWRWHALLERLTGTAAAAVYLLLSYFDRCRLGNVPSDFLEQLFLIQRTFGKLSLAAAHSMLDRYAMQGKQIGTFLSRRNLSIAWDGLLRPSPSRYKPLLIPFNICVPCRWRFQ